MTITVDKEGKPTCFSGDKAGDVFRLRTVHGALGMLAVGIKPVRGLTIKMALATATEYTGVVYKGKGDIEKAREDLKKIERLRVQHIEVKERS